MTPAEQGAIAKLPPVEDALRREFGIGRTEGSEGLTASLMQPALNIRGISSGAVGAAANNAPNENLRLKNLWNGIDAYAAEMGELRW